MHRASFLSAVALLVVASSLPAQAVEFLCGDICQCWVGCTRRCTDDTSGFSTTCGAAGYACNGQCARPAVEPSACVESQAEALGPRELLRALRERQHVPAPGE